jgi:hypothetical protein
MTLTLTPELTQAIEERAEEMGVSPECAVLDELNAAFLEANPWDRSRPTPQWRNLIDRRYHLIEKKYTVGLTEEELQEFNRLTAQIENRAELPSSPNEELCHTP